MPHLWRLQEMAHTDLHRTVCNLQRIYGADLLLNIVIGQNPPMLEQIAGQVGGTLAGLKFSRKFEMK